MNLREVIFGAGMSQVNLTALEKETGISKRTLFNYRETPERIPIAKAIIIAKAAGRADILTEWMQRVTR